MGKKRGSNASLLVVVANNQSDFRVVGRGIGVIATDSDELGFGIRLALYSFIYTKLLQFMVNNLPGICSLRKSLTPGVGGALMVYRRVIV